MPTRAGVVLLLLLHLRNVRAQCDEASEFSIQYDGSAVFSVGRVNKTCTCPSFSGNFLGLERNPVIQALNASISQAVATSDSVRLLPSGSLPACTGGAIGSLRYYNGYLMFCDAVGWQYVATRPPTISALSVSSGTFAGGTAVTVTGTGFTPTVSVRIGGQPATVTYVSPTQLTLTTPSSSSSGTKEVLVQTEGGTGVFAAGFTYRGNGLTPALAEFSCKYFVNYGTSRGDGLYYITGISLNNDPTLTYCDMTTSGGGWTLVGYNQVGTPQLAMPTLKCGGGSWNPGDRIGVAAVPSAALARDSTYMGFAQAATRLWQNGNMMAYDHVSYFNIPNPSIVTFDAHSYLSPYYASMSCVAVTVTCVKGCSGTYTRYTLNKSLGATWSDSYPTGYGAVTTSNCIQSYANGPYVVSQLSGAFASNCGACTPGCDYVSSNPTYNYQGMYYATVANTAAGTNSIWFK